MRDFIKKHINIILTILVLVCLVAIVFGIISLVNYDKQIRAQHASDTNLSDTDLPNPVAGDTNIYTPSPERKETTSLTLKEIHSLPMPTSYVLQKIENYEITEEGSYSYTDNPDRYRPFYRRQRDMRRYKGYRSLVLSPLQYAMHLFLMQY